MRQCFFLVPTCFAMQMLCRFLSFQGVLEMHHQIHVCVKIWTQTPKRRKGMLANDTKTQLRLSA